jgi:YD repeat-containing protein
MADLVAAAASVRRWVKVPETWAGYRPEPFAAERLWACGAGATGDGPRRRAGLDSDGHVVLVGPVDLPPEQWTSRESFLPHLPEWVDVVERSKDGRTVTVQGLWRWGEPRVTTTFDDAGRPLASVYAGGHPDERYVYDADGRLVAIEESPGFTSLAPAPWRHYEPVGGQLEVVHDERGPRMLRRADSGLVVWERLDRPWPDTLAAFAQALVAAAVAGLAEACRRDGRGPEEEIFSLALVPYPIALSELHPYLFAGREKDRRRILADPDEYVEEYLWWCQHARAESVMGAAELPVDVQRAAVRATAMHDLGDPLEMLCQAAVPLLAAHDWSTIFTPTPDFAVYVIGEDVGAADIYRSMLAGNPRERLAERAARWSGSPYPPDEED